MPKKTTSVGNQYAVRLDDKSAAVVEALRVRLSRERAGARVTVSDAIRVLVAEGAKHLK
jgi:hypothetical protein